MLEEGPWSEDDKNDHFLSIERRGAASRHMREVP
jgi:hypothetical protein